MRECNLQGEMVITINRHEDLDKISNMKLDLQLIENRGKGQHKENNPSIPVHSAITIDATLPAIPGNATSINITPPATAQATPAKATTTKATPPSAAIKISSVNAKAIAKTF